MSSDKLQEFQVSLVNDPFNNELRLGYAALLSAHHRWEDALNQFRLVLSAAESAAAHQGAAYCYVGIGQPEKAVEHYTRSKSFNDFEEQTDLQKLADNARPASTLSVIDGGRRAKVIDISQGRSSKTTFNDVAGMDELKKTLRMQIVEPFLNPRLFSVFRKKAGGGVLLYGPPGCGKTMMARAIATECKATFQSVGISDVLNMWLGESERNLALLFEQARANRPCVMFFDELDALAYSRSKSNSSSARTVVNEFLAQLDGFDFDNNEVLIMAATNMPWDVDPAMKRPGRFSRQIFVPPPDASARQAMLETKMAGIPVADIDYKALSQLTEHFSGADLDGLIDQAKDKALSDILATGLERKIQHEDFVAALDEISASTIDWLKTARNLVKYAGADGSYKAVARYLKSNKLA